MTAAVVLLAAVLLFGVFHYFTERRHTAERTRLINEILAKSAADFSLRQTASGQDEPKRRQPDPKKVKPGLPIGL